MKKILIPFLAGMILTACFSDSSSSSASFDMDESFEIIVEKGTFRYVTTKEDSTLILLEPVCKEGKLGNLVWKEEEDEGDSLQVRYDEKKKIVSWLESGEEEWEKLYYSGTVFPLGLWKQEKNEPVQVALSFGKKNEWHTVFSYKGKCFMEDFYSGVEEGNEAVEGMKDAFDESWSEFRVESCDKASLYDGLVFLRIASLKESSGRVVVSYGSKNCNADFEIRYAIDEASCKAAYDEFLLDKSEDEFHFEQYDVVSTVDEYCIAELMIDLRRDLGLPLEDKSLSKDVSQFTKNVGNFILGK